MKKKDLFKPYKGEEDYIFISYSHDDAEIVYDIISDIHNRGYRIWHDDGIPTGDNFVDTLAVKIKNCSIFLCFISSRYITSDYCKTELNYAFKQKKKVIPIMLENVELPEGIDFRFAAINWSSLSSFDSETELVDRLCDLDGDVLAPCRVDPPIHGFRIGEEEESGQPKEPQEIKQKQNGSGGSPPHQNNTLLIFTVAALVIAAIVISVFLQRKENAPVNEAVPTAAPAAEVSSTPAPVKTETPVPFRPVAALTPEQLAQSAKKAEEYLKQRIGEMCPMATYETEDPLLYTASCTYDNAVAALALLCEGDSESAAKILDALVEGMKADPEYSDRFRNAYMAGNSAALPGYWNTELNQWIQDAYLIGTGTKSTCAAAVALLRAYAEIPKEDYLNAAVTAVDWIIENCSDEYPGFLSGYTGWKDSYTKLSTKSTVDNVWMMAACRMLEKTTGAHQYADAAASAETFVTKTMFSPGDSRYFEGTKEDGLTPLTNLILTDVQALSTLCIGNGTVLNSLSGCLAADGGYSYSNADVSGSWLEGTAIAALALEKTGEKDASVQALSVMEAYQTTSGAFPQASVPALGTGEKERMIDSSVSVSPCAWYLLAVNGADPFAGVG